MTNVQDNQHSQPAPATRTVRFPNRIRAERRAQLMTVSALAERVSCSRREISRLEAGRHVPNAVLLHDIARALGVLVDALYDRDWSWQRRKNLHELPGISATTVENGGKRRDVREKRLGHGGDGSSDERSARNDAKHVLSVAYP